MGKRLEEIADKLYEAEPQTFVGARDEAVARAKQAGDNATAVAIAKLRKPTVAAWLVNLLALKRPGAVKDLLDLGESLREAQRRLRGEELRRLANQRRAMIASLVGQAQELAVRAQPDLSPAKLALTDVEATLTAALADRDIAEQVRTGRLTKTVSYAGFGELPDADAVPEPPRRRPPGKRDAGDELARRRAQRELEEAGRAQQAAREALEAAETAEREAGARLEELERQLEELEELRTHARKALVARRAEHKQAQRDLATADRRVAQLEAALE